MTVLDDLTALDLSVLLDARLTIKHAAGSVDIQAVVDGGAVQAALGDFGRTINALRESFEDPAALISPLVDRLGGLLGPLNLDDLPVVRYLEAVREGAEIMAQLFQGLDGNLLELGRPLGTSLGDLFDAAGSGIGEYAQVSLDNIASFRKLVDRVEHGLPSDPAALVDLAVDVLLPFPRSALLEMRDRIGELLDAAEAITLPSTRTQALAISMKDVAAAANSGDAGRLDLALQELESVRANSVGAIRDDILGLFSRIDRMRLGSALEPVVEASRIINKAEEGILEFLHKWQSELGDVRAFVESIEPEKIGELLDLLLDWLEQRAYKAIDETVDLQVERVKELLRGLLKHIPLRSLRAELSSYFQATAGAVEEADLGRYARAVRQAVDGVTETIESLDLGEEIRAAMEQVEEAINNFLDPVITALESISGRIDELADEASGIIDRLNSTLAGFKEAMDRIAEATDRLGIEDAVKQISGKITDLREVAEDLLTAVPLPDAMRPQVDQLIVKLDEIDWDEAFQPLRSAAEEFNIPDEITGTLTAVLERASEIVDNLVPAGVIASIEEELGRTLDVIRDFDPSSLLSGVTDIIEEGAGFVEQIDAVSLTEPLREPFRTVLELIDRAHPRQLLSPVIEAYEELMGRISVPSPDTATRRAAEVIGSAGENAGRRAIEPVRSLAPPGSVNLAEQPSAGGDAPPENPQVRPGDVVRMFGYLPAKIREGLANLQAGPAGEVLQGIDSLCGGLAARLRQVEAAVGSMETRIESDLDRLLAPLGSAQLEAQTAISANVRVLGAEVDVSASLDLVALAGPGAMRAALDDVMDQARTQARRASAAAGRAGSLLHTAASALERCRLAGFGSDLDAFLAALDPEPLAAELDLLAAAALGKYPGIVAQLEEELASVQSRIEKLVLDLNPGTQAQKFLTVLEVLREELDVLDPGRLADELGEIHAAIRAIVAAYDPTLLAREVQEALDAAAGMLRSLQPEELLADLPSLEGPLNRVESAVPSNALSDIGHSLEEVGQKLKEIDPSSLMAAIEELPGRLLKASEDAVAALAKEIKALLKSLRYASSSVSVSVEVETG